MKRRRRIDTFGLRLIAVNCKRSIDDYLGMNIGRCAARRRKEKGKDE